MFNHQRLRCYGLSIEVARAVPMLTRKWPRGHAYLIDQLKRAISSVILNIAEGNSRRTILDRKRFFSISRASAAEVSAVMDIADALNLIDKSTYNDMQDKLLQIVKMLYKL